MGKIILDKINKNVKFTPKKLRTLFNYLKKKTDNFKTFEPKFLINKPSLLRVLRLMLGLNTIDFGKRFEKSSSTIQSLEEERFNLSMSKAKEYTEIIKDLIEEYNLFNINYKTLKENYNRFYTNRLFSIMQSKVPREVHVISGKNGGTKTLERYGVTHFKKIAKMGASLGGIAVSKKYSHEHYQRIGKMTSEIYGFKNLSNWGKKGGLKTASEQKLTEQENIIKRFLDKNRIKNIPHKIIKGKNRKYVVDFLIENKNNRMIIESTNQTHRKGIGSYNKALGLIKRFKDITKENSKLKFIFVLNKQFSIEGIIKLSRYGCVLVNDKLNLLNSIIKNIKNSDKIKAINKDIIDYALINKRRFSKGAIAVKDLNEQEEEILIKNYLSKLNIPFEAQAVLKNKNGSIRIVDFVVPSIKNPKIIIETTKVNNKSDKSLIRTINRLEEKFKLIKDFYIHNCIFVGIINKVNQKELDKFATKSSLLSINNLDYIRDISYRFNII